MELNQLSLVLVLFIGVLFSNLVTSKPSVSFTNSSSVGPYNFGTGTDEKTENFHNAFISYRRSLSKHLAMLTKVLLKNHNISTYLDVEDLEAGYWDIQLNDAIKESPNFIIMLSNGTLDRCIGDNNYTDPLHKEIKTAIESKRNVVPVFDDYTHPIAEFSPEINEMMRFQGVEWNHSLVNATIHRLMRYLKEDPLSPATAIQFDI